MFFLLSSFAIWFWRFEVLHLNFDVLITEYDLLCLIWGLSLSLWRCWSYGYRVLGSTLFQQLMTVWLLGRRSYLRQLNNCGVDVGVKNTIFYWSWTLWSWHLDWSWGSILVWYLGLELWIWYSRFNPILTADDRLITGTTLVLAAAEWLLCWCWSWDHCIILIVNIMDLAFGLNLRFGIGMVFGFWVYYSIWTHDDIVLNDSGVMSDAVLSRSPSREQRGCWGCPRTRWRDIHVTVFVEGFHKYNMHVSILMIPILWCLVWHLCYDLLRATIIHTLALHFLYVISAFQWTYFYPGASSSPCIRHKS